MDYQQALDFLYSSLPMFQRDGKKAYKADLSNIIRLSEALGNPHHNFKSIHIAGTNGKGTSAHMIASILQEAGYRTGLFTSPHLKSFTERIKINGREVSEGFVTDFINQNKPAIDSINPSFFEITVMMAFQYFSQQEVDIAVIEVGLGGRLDSTNIITPLVSLITNISLDHTDLLGDDLEGIAREKAGIIKPGLPVIVGARDPDLDHVFMDVAREFNSNISFAPDFYRANGPSSFFDQENGKEVVVNSPIHADYMSTIIPGILLVVKQLIMNGFVIDDQVILKGINKVKANTGLKGRWQVLDEKPLVICDIAHNNAAIKSVVMQLGTISYNKLFMVWGMVSDKDAQTIFQLLPKEAYYFMVEPKIPRAMPATLLGEQAKKAGLQFEIGKDVNTAIHKAKERSGSEDVIFIGGSTFVVAEIADL